ncbi:hypothetical protein V8G54_001922 [Vigna mungo]|uniref:Uncharacterized protein n=1 Tax=Vigna mungo TaxID=3915 RepID=A0AAQ3PBA0_VIGMU
MYKENNRVRHVRLQTLRGEFENLKIEDKERVTEYITQVKKVVNQLDKNGEPMLANLVGDKILRSLKNDFKSIVSAIEEFKDLLVLLVKELVRPLRVHEQRRMKKNETLDQALPHNLA